MPQQDRIIATPELLARISATASASVTKRVRRESPGGAMKGAVRVTIEGTKP